MSESSRLGPGRGGSARWCAAGVALLVALASSVMLASSANASTFTNGASLDVPARNALPRSGPASIYPSEITVSGLPGGVVRATVTVRGIFHQLGHELDALLVAPNGAKSILFSDACATPDVVGFPFSGDFTFEDGAPPLGSAPCGRRDTVRPTDGGLGSEDFPAPAPDDPHTAAMANFVGAPANGIWRLFVQDDTGECGAPPFCGPTSGVGGQITRGWSLNLLPEATCAGRPAVLADHVGTAGDDELQGTPGPDVLVGLGGNDEIAGSGGGDVICGGSGNDSVSGQIGGDKLRGGRGADRLRGGRGKDRIVGGKGRDRCKGGEGTDKQSSC